MARGSQPENEWSRVATLIVKDVVGAGTCCLLNKHRQRKLSYIYIVAGRKNATIYDV